jgi:hypothetical protein
MSASIGIEFFFLIAAGVCAVISFQSVRRPILLPLSVVLVIVAIMIGHAGGFQR